MQCRYCKTENFTSIGACAACGKPLSESVQHITFSRKNAAYYRRHGTPYAGIQTRYAFHIPAGMSVKGIDPAAPAAPAIHDGDDLLAATTAAPPLQNPAHPPAPSPPQRASQVSTPPPETHPETPEEDRTPLFGEPVMTADELERRFPGYRKKPAGFGRVLMRIAMGVGFFAIAVAAGIIGTLWIGNHGDLQAMLAMLVPDRVLTQPPTGRPDAPVSTATSPGELPYDGLTPEPAEHSRAGMDTPAATAEPSKPIMAPSTDTADMPAMSVDAPASPPPASSVGPPDKPSIDVGAAAAAAAASSDKQTVAAPEKASEAAPAKVKKARPPQHKVARGKEISRIQQQAAEELKRRLKNGE
ncbi:MAG TPA: hypothetical protein VJ577_10305 [Burkholderiaceae bacterium]|nr:hypothetical protein [Burkholderiaceae bacterium]